MSDRISRQFATAANEGRAAMVSYVCAGDPDFQKSLAACKALLDSGTDLLELGIPFSDPLADGPTNQLAADRALRAGMTLEQCFQLAAELRTHSDKPLIFFTYYNIVFARGEENFLRAAKAAGVDGILILDLPPEEASDWISLSQQYQLATVFLMAPTTPPERMALISKVAQGFIYYVSREGVTGVQTSVVNNLSERVAQIKQHTHLPVAVGFGISNAEQVAEVAAAADGVVVGSALVNTIAALAHESPDLISQTIAKQNKALCAGLGKS
ncbi:MAG: tryptophan synthase subunit alpha [Verrucomicrobia bacterium]|nr:tryptophan synthase subunit alpha [Verrucomicrobiota bacterium]